MGSPKPGLAEDEIVERIRRTLGGGIRNDDAASVLVPGGGGGGGGGGSLVVSVDTVVEGVHFELDLCSPADVGWKALMSALSDLAAMGARPVGALVALCVPEGREVGSEEVGLGVAVMEGVAEAAAAAQCAVVGGDVSSAGQLMVSVTVMGTTDGDAVVERSGARAGDVVLVSGPCGGSAAGLRVLRAGVRAGVRGAAPPAAGALAAAYRRPVARLAEGVAVRLAGAHAMIDISDGLALDMHRLADASHAGFRLTAIPVAEGATWDEAVGGGEDYELLMTVAGADVERLMGRFADAGLPSPLPIGVITGDVSERLLGRSELGRHGWQHQIG